MSYGFKSVAEAKKLRTHIEDLFEKHVKTDKAESVVGLHMVIVGAGPNGVDLAGELAALDQRLNAPLLGVVEYQVAPNARAASAQINIGLLKSKVPEGNIATGNTEESKQL